ncbi:MAG TPA: type II toxin-antitoxin system PemK/MazF family toxin [Blastocatellia bacterium]|nr:type II toxin-antitoxin system PemK/MazF family toxin [Blastocatellia bacterium]
MPRPSHKFQRGDVVLVPFPYADLTTTKQRPAVVISGATYHQTEPDIILAAITGQIPQHPAPTDYPLQDWQQAGLLMPSLVKSFLVTIEPALVRHQLGRLTARDLREVKKRLRLALEI